MGETPSSRESRRMDSFSTPSARTTRSAASTISVSERVLPLPPPPPLVCIRTTPIATSTCWAACARHVLFSCFCPRSLEVAFRRERPHYSKTLSFCQCMTLWCDCGRIRRPQRRHCATAHRRYPTRYRGTRRGSPWPAQAPISGGSHGGQAFLRTGRNRSPRTDRHSREPGERGRSHRRGDPDRRGVHRRYVRRLLIGPEMLDLETRWQLHPRVALRPEPFGALLYHFGTRKLSFLKNPRIVEIVRSLPGHTSARAAIRAASIGDSAADPYV